MSSGVGVNEDCLARYQSLKRGQKVDGAKLKYIIFNLNSNNTEIVVDKISGDSDYESFIETLPENECRWAVYDFEYDLGDAGKRNKIIFIAWSPDTSRIKQKMVFASSKDALRRSLDGIGAEIQATALDEVTFETILEKVSKK